jgi:membrane associated rhomboid family serine protease
MFSAPIILIAIIVLVSIQAWKNDELYRKLLFRPYEVKKHNEWHRFVTSGFIHADYTHLIFNCASFYFFSGGLVYALESEYMFGSYGQLVFIALFLLGIIVADLPSYFKHKDSIYYSSLGASGGVSSIIFASILVDPTSKISLLFIPIWIPAFLYGILYLMYSYHMAQNSNDRINHSAHFIGSLFGVVFLVLLKPDLVGFFIDQITVWRW